MTKYKTIYKVVRNYEGEIVDFQNVNEFDNYVDVKNYLRCAYEDVKSNVAKNLRDVVNLNLIQGEYFIMLSD